MTELILSPVGYVRGSRSVPVDDHWDGEHCTIELVAPYGPDSLLGLTDFSHLEVLFHFHKLDGATVTNGARHPRNNPTWPLTGIFAQRGAGRPNRLGTTLCRLLGVEGTSVHVFGLDAIDGTPVLDIKPVMDEFLPRGALRQPAWSTELMRDYWVGQE